MKNDPYKLSFIDKHFGLCIFMLMVVTGIVTCIIISITQGVRLKEENAFMERHSKPELIHKTEDCETYRFYDFNESFRAKYFTNCKVNTTTTFDHIEACGKGCSKVVEESTNTSKDIK